MGLRKAAAYSKKIVVPYTRASKKKNRAYIKSVPPQKIVKFTMGLQGQFEEGKLPFGLLVLSTENCQIRHNSLEACRQYINKALDKELSGQFFFKIYPYPHHIQRENKMLTGAGADRMQTGMQLSFGKTIGKAAIVKPKTKIFLVAVPNEKASAFARKTIKQIKPKLPCRIKIIEENYSKDNLLYSSNK